MKSFIPQEIIQKKKSGLENTKEELDFLVNSYVSGEVPDYQMAAWCMAVYFQGMTDNETTVFTQLMRDSGEVIDFSDFTEPVVDKHSTGGVGDKCTLILAPIAAACGVKVASIAGRGLGHTGGTVDKLESIKDFNVFIDTKKFKAQIKEMNLSIMGQTEKICPADKKIYALRDVTSTVDSIPLICASIMSKKLAEGISGLVLDIKCGSGAFMKTKSDAQNLAKSLMRIGELSGVKVISMITNMNQPLGKYIGNSLEIKECLDILQNKSCKESGIDFYHDTRELSLQLASHMIVLAKKANNFEQAYLMAKNALTSGEAFEVFKKMCAQQGASDIFNFPTSVKTFNVLATKSGFITSFNTEGVGQAGVLIKAGRMKTDDKIIYQNGIELHCKLGLKVEKGQKLFTLYCDNDELLNLANTKLLHCVEITDKNIEDQILIYETMGL